VQESEKLLGGQPVKRLSVLVTVLAAALYVGGLTMLAQRAPDARRHGGANVPTKSVTPADSSQGSDDDRPLRHRRRVPFSLGPSGEGFENSGTLLVATHLNNISHRTAFHVQIETIKLNSAPLLTPATLPVPVGKIDAGQSAIIQASFDSSQLIRGHEYPLVVHGRYRPTNKGENEDRGEAEGLEFTVRGVIVLPPAAPGSAAVNTGSVPAKFVSGGGFPHQPPQPPGFVEVDVPGWTVPTGPFVPVTPTPTSTGTKMAPKGDPGTVVFIANNGLGLNANTCCAEPSGASGGGVIFATANSFAAYSTNGGTTFTQLDPTTIFPNGADGGFCCDQIVQYVPSIDRFIWLMQFWRGSGGSGSNRMRIASASPAEIISSNGTAWTYWDLTSEFFGLSSTSWLDYPDLAVGNNDLYMSCDEVGVGLEVARIPLSQIQAGGTIFVDFTDPTNSPMAYGGHLSQDTGDEIFWAGHNDTSQMRIFSLMEGSNTYFWQDIGISSWSNNNLSSVTPDGQDWLTKLRNFPGNAVLGATRVFNQLWFAWSAGTDNNFQQAHVEMVDLGIDSNNPPNITVNQQVQIWNNSYAFAYPALATNACTSEVGLSLENGGTVAGGATVPYENHVVGFWGDFLVYITTSSDVGTGRYGDYVTIRQEPATDANPGNLFGAFGYGLNTVPPPGSGTQTDIRSVLFGRPSSSCVTLK
jgi:hypothetical protein